MVEKINLLLKEFQKVTLRLDMAKNLMRKPQKVVGLVGTTTMRGGTMGYP